MVEGVRVRARDEVWGERNGESGGVNQCGGVRFEVGFVQVQGVVEGEG